MLRFHSAEFTLLDATGLIAAVASCWCPSAFTCGRTGIVLRVGRHPFWQAGLDANIVVVPPALSLTAALWLLRMMPPRPKIRRLFRQPGLAAGTATMVFALSVLMSFVIYASNDRGFHPESVNELNLGLASG